MKLIDTSVKRPIGVLISIFIVLLIGIVSLRSIAVDLYPNFNIPVAYISTSYEGAAPEEIENLVTKPLERSLSTIEGLDTIQSSSVSNQSFILMVFQTGTNLDKTLNDIREKVDQVKGALPQDAKTPLVMKIDPNAKPILQLSLSGNDQSLQTMTELAEDLIQPQIERITGVAEASLTGIQSKEIKVEVDPSKLEGYGLSIADISQAISMNNKSMPAGNILRGSQDMNIRLLGEYKQLKDLERLLISTPSKQTIRLTDVAKIEESFTKQSAYSYINGEPAIGISVTKQSDANTVQVAKEVIKQVENLASSLPAGVSLQVVSDSSEFIQSAIDNVLKNLIYGSILASIVLWLFLRNFRSTLVIILSIPISIISTFIMMYFFGETINMLTMSGLALGVGMMVDSSIVILENIFRYRQQGYKRLKASIAGAKEVVMAVIASALTTVVAFLPVAFTQGMAGQLFKPLALTISFSLISSLIVSITLVPMLASRLLKTEDIVSKKWTNQIGSMIKERYSRFLHWSLRRKKTVLSITVGSMLASLLLLPLLKMDFIPALDQGEIQVTATLPEGTNIEETSEVVTSLENFLVEKPSVELVSSTIGGAGGRDGDQSNKGNLFIRLHKTENRNKSTEQIIEEISEFANRFPDLKLNTAAVQDGGIGQSAVSLKIAGNDVDILQDLSEEVETILTTIPGIANINNSMGDTRPELQIHVNQDAADYYNLTVSQVMQNVRASFQGQVATSLKIDGQEINVFVSLPEIYRKDLNHLQDLQIMTPMGTAVPLAALAEIKIVDGPNTITRENMERGIEITADVFGRDLRSVTRDIEQVIDSMNAPEGYRIYLDGQNAEQRFAFKEMLIALVLSIILVYSIMAIQFESILYPFIIMFSIPATIIGVIVGLFITRQPLNAPALVGLIMLAGIVVNNGIIMVDYINSLRAQGMERAEALVTGSTRRLRPIFMTMLTTVLGMLPLAIGLGEGSELQRSLGIVIVFGLSFSTLITLFVIPIMYVYLDNMSMWLRKLFFKKNDADQVSF